MSQSYRVLCLSRAESPITHMSGSAGNESIVAREAVTTPRGTMMVPFLSGNAIRHRLIREPGARWLVDQYGLAGKLTKLQLNFLFHGGNLTESGGLENTRRIAEWQRIFPLGRLLGGSLPNQILAGSMISGRGVLVCEENRKTLESLFGDDAQALPKRLRPAEAFISGYQYTRGDAIKTAVDLLDEPSANDAGTQLMIYSGQSVLRGACFVHDFVLQHVARVELGALLLSLTVWQQMGGTIGSMGARGHGRLTTWLVNPPEDTAGAVAEYQAHAASVQEDAVAWLNDAFGAAKEKLASEAKGNGKKAGRKAGAPA